MAKEALDSAIKYFKSSPVFIKLMKEMAGKYYSYGEFKGTIDKELLGNNASLLAFLGVNKFRWEKTKRFKVSDFEEALEHSRFAGISIFELVQGVIGKKLVTKQSIDEENERAFQRFLTSVQVSNPKVCSILSESKIKSYYTRDAILDDFIQVEKCLNNIPAQPTRLPVFAFLILKNPHGLDKTTTVGKMFLECIKLLRPKLTDGNEIYLSVNIVKDDILNFVTVQNIDANDDLFHAASSQHMVWNVPLMKLLELDSAFPSKGNKVFLIENSSVYAIIVDKLKDIPIIMTSGQFKYSTWKLLSLLPKNVEIYHSSDLDPAGLIMSNNLMEKFGDRVHLFGMSSEIYLKKVDSGVKLTNENLSKVKGINNPTLQSLKQNLITHHKAVYQESEIEELIDEIQIISETD
ncbi:TIGR02679 domain-containing protein [Companilactobacillus ginsenosidimutans]|uniref:DUF2399 domain-containing protein n=1 Tax=Companilactobacillus ginsenosidimutans TaxID=1007676 RepID=A0A0H4QHJ5_9LACO|nr:TIGR02679 domain-containing protein [Companilactobacillus ginsenosidimutans]AKP67412.1 hypothetical protein ABM34_07600 [Companilactobacillus ginsenosidimutans]